MRALILGLITWWLVDGKADAAAGELLQTYDLKAALRFVVETNTAAACPRVLAVYLHVENLDDTDCTWTFDPVFVWARVRCVPGGIPAERPPLSIRRISRTELRVHRIPAKSAVDVKMSDSTELVNAYGTSFDLRSRTVLMVGLSLWLIENVSITDQLFALQLDSRPWCLAGCLPAEMPPGTLEIPWTRVSLRRSTVHEHFSF